MRSDLMVQQQVKSKWEHMVGVICLNLTHGREVKKILPKLFEKWPDAEAFIKGRYNTQEKMLRPLGMSKVRSKRLRQMSKDFLTWDGENALDLHGIGKYGSDSYRIFYKNDIPDDVEDKELKRYINVT